MGGIICQRDIERQKWIRVEAEHDRLPVRLVLRVREDILPPFPTLSWRTNYRSGTNRQFYWAPSQGGYWIIPVHTALNLLVRAEERGWLNEEYDDPQDRHGGNANTVMDSRTLSRQQSLQLFSEITTDDGEPNWGNAPIFIVIETPDHTWRKVIIIDTGQEFCTFRSTTTDSDYGMGIDQGMRAPWRLDKAMQDASASMMRIFLGTLRSL